ncbi:MAG: hypothetical protein JSU63_13690 [Phycisphaerales bacterium]|nr:MAG: hypothetical protein JSU63_13690 [Phycisphaerales bacterium]
MLRIPYTFIGRVISLYLVAFFAFWPGPSLGQVVVGGAQVPPVPRGEEPEPVEPDTLTVKVVALDVLWPGFFPIGMHTGIIPFVDGFLPLRDRSSQSATGIITATVSSAGEPVEGVVVHLEANPLGAPFQFLDGGGGGSGAASDLVTDANGVAIATIEGLATGSAMVHASVPESSLEAFGVFEIVKLLDVGLNLFNIESNAINANNGTGLVEPQSVFTFTVAGGDGTVHPESGVFTPGDTEGDVGINIDYRVDGQTVELDTFTFPVVDFAGDPDDPPDENIARLIHDLGLLTNGPFREIEPGTQVEGLDGAIALLEDASATIHAYDSLYVTTTLGVDTADISIPSTPSPLGGLPTPTGGEGIDVRGNTAVVALGVTGVQVLDVSDPANPTVTALIDTPGFANDVGFVHDTDLVVVADGLEGVQVIELGDTPAIIGHLPTSAAARDIRAVIPEAILVAADTAGLLVVDVSEPGSPSLVDQVLTTGTAYGVEVFGDYAYVADGDAGMHVVDISSLASGSAVPLQIVGSVDTPGFAHSPAVIDFDTVLLADDAAGLQILDVTDPTAPAIDQTVTTTDRAVDVVLWRDVAFVSDCLGGVQVIDVPAALDGDPGTPAIIGALSTSACATSVAPRDSRDGLYDSFGVFLRSLDNGAADLDQPARDSGEPDEPRGVGAILLLILTILVGIVSLTAGSITIYNQIAPTLALWPGPIITPITLTAFTPQNINIALIQAPNGALTVSDNRGTLMVGKIQAGAKMTVQNSYAFINVLDNDGTLTINWSEDLITVEKNNGTMVINDSNDTIIVVENYGVLTINGNEKDIYILNNYNTIIINKNPDYIGIANNRGSIDINDNVDDILIEFNMSGAVVDIKGNRGRDITVDRNAGTVNVTGNSENIVFKVNRSGTINITVNGDDIWLPKPRLSNAQMSPNPAFGTVNAGMVDSLTGCPEGPGWIKCNQ